jgi:hypothetical protein
MKLRLADIEEAIKDPRAFVRAQNKASRQFGRSRYLTLRNVALGYHKHYDLGISEALLESRLLSQFKSEKGNDECLEMLREYAAEFDKLGTTVASVRNNVKVPLTPDYVGFQVSGQVARLDVNPSGGYCAWLLTNKTDKWSEELRFPLLQYACATQLNVDVEEVVTGVYDFSRSVYTRLPYTKRQVRNARQKLKDLLDELKRVR